MKASVLRLLGKLFPVHPHEWPKALVLLSVATLLGMSFSMSRAASEGLFLTRLGVHYLPTLLLVNPLLVLVASAVYGAFADRIPNDRLLIYTTLLPVPLILLLYLLMIFDATWVYFVLYTFVLAYASILTTSWTVYIAGHYDAQESKRLLPFITSGILIGTVVGGVGVAASVSYIGTRNVLLLWVGTSLGIAAVVWWLAQRFTALDTESRKTKRGAKQPGMLQNLKEGLAFSRASSLFMTTGIVSVATMVAIQLLDFEYSKILARAYPDPATLTAFLGIFDGLTNIAALLLQWFFAPWSIRPVWCAGSQFVVSIHPDRRLRRAALFAHAAHCHVRPFYAFQFDAEPARHHAHAHAQRRAAQNGGTGAQFQYGCGLTYRAGVGSSHPYSLERYCPAAALSGFGISRLCVFHLVLLSTE